MFWALSSLACLCLGILLGWLLRAGRVREIELRLQAELTRTAEREKYQAESQAKVSDSFKAMSQDALLQSNTAFLQLANQHLKTGLDPVRAALTTVDEKIQKLELARTGAYEKLEVQVRSLSEGQTKLRDETAKLVNALRTPSQRGKWGETQLRRVVELAGMSEHCDFTIQPTAITEAGTLRPDLIVHLPGNKTIVIDAKAPLLGYLEAIEATTEQARKAGLDAHAGHVRNHIGLLGKKAYFQHFQPSPDFVILFLPGEAFLSGALESDPSLVDKALESKVVLASPTTLIALLRTIAYVWQQQTLADGAVEIQKLGAELHQSLRAMMAHWNNTGKNLDRLVRAYNETSVSLETRVLVKARRFDEVAAPAQVDRTVRMDPEAISSSPPN